MTSDTSQDGEWLTYRQIADRLGVKVDSAKAKRRRAGWQTTRGNDGQTRIFVPRDALSRGDISPPTSTGDNPGNSGKISGLQAEIEGLHDRLARTDAHLAEVRADRDWHRQRADQAERDRAEKAERLARIEAELEGERRKGLLARIFRR